MGKQLNPKPGDPIDLGGINIPDKPDLKNLASVDKKILEKLPQELQVHLNEIMFNEKTIVDKLKDPNQKKLFLENPLAFFQNNKINVSAAILSKLKAFNYNEFMKKQSFILPNGKVLNPKININLKLK